MATRMGVHRHDHRWADRSPDAMQGWGEELQGFGRRFQGIDPTTLTGHERLDLQWALAVLDYALVNQELELWQRSPQTALQDVGTGLHSLLIGEFAPLEARLESLSARLDGIPSFLETARSSLRPESTPSVWIESSLPQAKGIQKFIAEEIPKAAEQVPALAGEVARACERAAQATKRFERFLQECSGVAEGDFAIGQDRFERILQRFHMLDMDCDDLYEFGREWIDRYERRLTEVAREIDPDKSWATILEGIKDDHPQPDGLRQAYEDETMLARSHCLEHDLITFPESETCALEWTPMFMRARVPIALPWVSPAFEPGLASKWYVTPVDPEAPPERQRQHIRDNSWAWIRGIACLLYTSPSPRDATLSRMPSSA